MPRGSSFCRDFFLSYLGNFYWHLEVCLRNSLVVQWLVLCPSTEGGMGSIPGRGIKSPESGWSGQKSLPQVSPFLYTFSNLYLSTPTPCPAPWINWFLLTIPHGALNIFLIKYIKFVLWICVCDRVCVKMWTFWEGDQIILIFLSIGPRAMAAPQKYILKWSAEPVVRT